MRLCFAEAKIHWTVWKAHPALWNPWPVTTACHTGRKFFSLAFQGVDKEKPNQAFFPVL